MGLLAIFAAAMTMAVPSLPEPPAQKYVTDEEFVMCMAMDDVRNRLLGWNRRAYRKSNNMSVNRRSCDSVSRFNEAQAVTNITANIYDDEQRRYRAICVGIRAPMAQVDRLCNGVFFGRSYANGGFCKGWERISSLPGEPTMARYMPQGEPYAVAATLPGETVGFDPSATFPELLGQCPDTAAEVFD